MSTSTQQNYASQIYAAAIAGNDVNPGLPDSLAQLLVDQSAHETNGWTSNFFLNGNACFGYSCVYGSKWQSGCSNTNADNGVRVGYYASINDSTQEVVDWIYRRVKEGEFPSDLSTITSADQYAALLKKAGYYGDTQSNYSAGLKRWANTLSDFFKTR